MDVAPRRGASNGDGAEKMDRGQKDARQRRMGAAKGHGPRAFGVPEQYAPQMSRVV
jgi:hypothetical protein